MYSFCARPIASGMCDAFLPFYFYTDDLYAQGTVIGIVCLCLYTTGLMLGLRAVSRQRVVDFSWLHRVATLALVSCILLDVTALAIYGAIFLPGEREAGLGITAPGSQVYFALVSVMTLIGTAITAFGATSGRVQVSIVSAGVRFFLFFLLSMIFFQRGALLSGIVLGLFMSSIYSKTFFLKNVWRSLAALAGVIFIAFQGRAFISRVIALVSGKPMVEEVGVWRDTLVCRIANQGSQEHDQVWPTVIHYQSIYGPDYYFNLIASLLRSFLSSAQRAELGFLTSVDSLNIYNNASTYLTLNFGFSISPFQYHYYSAGIFALPISLALGFFSSRTENAMASHPMTARGFVLFVFLYQLLLLLNGAFDEQLRWSVLSCLLVLMLAGSIRVIRGSGRGAQVEDEGAADERPV
jgi:hypothetical protein